MAFIKASRQCGFVIRETVKVRSTQPSCSMQLRHTMGVTLNDGFLEIDLFKIRCSLLQNINLQLLSTAYDRDHNIDEQHF